MRDRGISRASSSPRAAAFFWVGDETVSLPQGTVPRGQMFVQWEAPADRDEAVPDRARPRRRRPGHGLARHPRRPPGLGDVPAPGGLRGLRRRQARTRPRALPPGRARADGQPALDRARLPALHERRRLAGGASRPQTSTPSGRGAAIRTIRASASSPPGPVRCSRTFAPRTPWNANAAQPCSTTSGRRS